MCFHRADKQHMAVDIDKAVPLKNCPKQTAEPTRPGTRRKLQLLYYLLSRYFQILKTEVLKFQRIFDFEVFYLDFTPDGKELYKLLTRTELSHLERT